MTYVLVISGRRIFKNMYVEPGSAKTGKIGADQVYDPTNIKLA